MGPVSSDLRGHSRMQLRVPIKFFVGDRQYDGHTRDLSVGGVFIETDVAVRYGNRVRVVLSLPTGGEPVDAGAVVRWIEDRVGFGVQFDGLRAREVYALTRFLSRGAA